MAKEDVIKTQEALKLRDSINKKEKRNKHLFEKINQRLHEKTFIAQASEADPLPEDNHHRSHKDDSNDVVRDSGDLGPNDYGGRSTDRMTPADVMREDDFYSGGGYTATTNNEMNPPKHLLKDSWE